MGGADVWLAGDGNEMGGWRYERLACREDRGTRQLPSGWHCLQSTWYFLVLTRFICFINMCSSYGSFQK